MERDLFLEIKRLEPKLIGKRRVIAQYLLSHFEEVPFQNLADLADKTGVSESTIIRFTRILGFRGFPELRDELQTIILKKITPSERLYKYSEIPASVEKTVYQVFQKEISNIKEAQERLDLRNIEEIVHCLIKARKKYVVGLRASSGCAYLLGHFLSHILPDVVTILVGNTRLFEGLKSINEEDALIAISFPRYTRGTVDALQFAKERHATTIAITDSELSPPAQISQYTLTTPVRSVSFPNSYTACLCLIYSLITLITHIDEEQTKKMLKEWEKSVDGFDFFYTD